MKRTTTPITLVLTVSLLLAITYPCWADDAASQPSSTQVSATTSAFELPDNLGAIESVYALSDAAKARLQASGMVVLPEQNIERLSSGYMRLFGETQVAVLITSDMALHLFHNVLDDLLVEIERSHLQIDVQWLVQQLYAAAAARYETIESTQPLSKAAARHDVLLFAVAARLLDDHAIIPDYVEPEASQYVAKVLAHSDVELYPGDDYTQFEPRGHYAGDELLERYFRTVKWLSRRIFRIEDRLYPSAADEELVAAAFLAQFVTQDPAILARWNRVYDVTRLLAGPADSITPALLQEALDNAFGAGADLECLEQSASRAALRAELQRDVYPSSEIIPVPALPGQISLKYVQFLGERFLPDAQAMQATCSPQVAGRYLPSGLDVAATVLSSQRAEHWLAAESTLYAELGTQITALRTRFDQYTIAEWCKSIYNGWLYSLRPLLQAMPSQAPAFMQGTAWQDKELNTALASWTQLRHDFILYGKQSYSGTPWLEEPLVGLIEPVPATFERLATLCEQARTLLAGYGMLPALHDHSLSELATTLHTWQSYATRVAAGEALSAVEQRDIHGVGQWLNAFFLAGEGVPEKSPLLVVDVATDAASGGILHEGTGLFNPIVFVFTPPGGKPTAGIGYVFSQYEFVEADWQRLNDAQWATRLQEASPSRPAWATSFLPLKMSLQIFLPLVIR